MRWKTLSLTLQPVSTKQGTWRGSGFETFAQPVFASFYRLFDPYADLFTKS